MLIYDHIWYTAGKKTLARMGRDKRGVLRGKCLKCSECDEYETTGTGSILCEYCGHTPVEHEIVNRNAAEDTPAKKPRLEAVEGILEEVSDHCVAQLDNIVDDPASASGLALSNAGDTLLAKDTAASPLKASETENDLTSSLLPEKSVEVMEVSADGDTELQDQQIKANELAKQETGDSFAVKRRQGKLFVDCNVCLSEVAVGKASQGLSLLRLHISTSKHKLNAAIAQSRSTEMPKEIQELRDQIESKFPKVFLFQGEEVLCRACKTTFVLSQRSLINNLKQHVDGRGHQQKAPRVASTADIASFFNRPPSVRTQGKGE